MTTSLNGDRSGPVVVAARPLDAKQCAAAFSIAGMLVLGLVLLMPVADVQFRRLEVALPVVQTIISAACLMTTALLIAQYLIQPDRGLLIVAAGYSCWGIFAFLQIFVVPLEEMPRGLIGDGRNSAAWIFWLWHVSFPLSIVGYVFTRGHSRNVDLPRSVAGPIWATIGGVAAAAAIVGWLVTAGVSHLPNLLQYRANNEPLSYYFVAAELVLTVFVIVLLLERGRTILDLWLTVVLVASLLDLTVSMVIRPAAFSAAWYAARGYALVASSAALLVMLVETISLYGRLANVLLLLQRERADRIMSVDAATATLAHELRQPLTAIRSSASAARNWLNMSAPDVGEARAATNSIIDAADRAETIISKVRELFRRETDHRQLISIGKVVRESLVLIGTDLRTNQISVRLKCGSGLPSVRADRLQLQQVLVNLIKNAIDAMSSTPPKSRRLEIKTFQEPASMVRLLIDDTGRGIPPEQQNKMFSSFFTTKTTGMGLGLAICRSIIADHGGTLRVLKSDAGGTSLEVALPVASNGQLRPR